ncbi:hypothetical protein [Streptomyces lichenis]|uniref:Uncharacterized protein n=1 Tax=Streptomyces lichenis TaxID=2306967 RepID=A0ABT0IAR7_9ACTN|nr:hypothetical protein [Streptomyces lichenis]MCK8678416.1 hypothetical protein [Streptomyces lichenis]
MGLLQAVALDVVTQPGWRTHLRGLGRRLAARRDLLAGALAEHVPEARLEAVPRGGLNLWARLPDGTDPERLVRGAAGRTPWREAGGPRRTRRNPGPSRVLPGKWAAVHAGSTR